MKEISKLSSRIEMLTKDIEQIKKQNQVSHI